jgi:transcriptional regulator GlxA family with amidase domain
LGATAERVRVELRSLPGLEPGPERLGRLIVILGIIAAAPPSHIRRIARHAAEPLSGPADDPWQALVRHLHDHADTPLALAGLAARMRLSPASFARAFRRRFAMTCTAYLTRVRLARVSRELIDSDRSIADIALGAGFGNLANFNRRFRGHHGTTPSAFRASHRRLTRVD